MPGLRAVPRRAGPPMGWSMHRLPWWAGCRVILDGEADHLPLELQYRSTAGRQRLASGAACWVGRGELVGTGELGDRHRMSGPKFHQYDYAVAR